MFQKLNSMENTGTAETTAVKTKVEVLNPKKKYDTVIVFGQGPVKPVLLPSELTDKQRQEWKDFEEDPLHKNEPRFRVLKSAEREFGAIIGNPELTESERRQLIEVKRQKWQSTGSYALNRWGRENALAAGLGLVSGLTDSLILSGGKTKPDLEKEQITLPEERLAAWPSEAELMKQIIVGRYGALYAKSHPGHSIEEAIKIEDKSTNTLENLGYTINNSPELLKKEAKIGLLATDFHIRRVGILTRMFSLKEQPKGQLSAQQELLELADARRKPKLREIQEHLTDTLKNEDLRNRLKGEELYEEALIEPDYISYWIGYPPDVEDPTVLQNVITSLQDPTWITAARREFAEKGLDFDSFTETDLRTLEQTDRKKYDELRERLRIFKIGGNRKVPPAR